MQSYAPCKLAEGLNFVNGPGTAVPWSVTFAQTGGVSYIASETSLAPTKFGRHHYSAVSIAFENVRAVDRFSYGVSSFVPDDTLILDEP